MIDQARKDGFRLRNVDEVFHPPANTRSSDPTITGIPEIEEKERLEDPEKDKVPAFDYDNLKNI